MKGLTRHQWLSQQVVQRPPYCLQSHYQARSCTHPGGTSSCLAQTRAFRLSFLYFFSIPLESCITDDRIISLHFKAPSISFSRESIPHTQSPNPLSGPVLVPQEGHFPD
ncbi:hypothetical protein ABPG72_021759 [Tetrahymena utriculariae]